jgi:PhnB protein
MKVSGTYLTFNGTCREAMTFYSTVFGSKIYSSMTFADHQFPMDEMEGINLAVTEEDKDRMMHMSLMIGDHFPLMACDTHPLMHKKSLQAGNNFAICLEPETKEEAHRLFSALEKGGSDAIPMQDMFWGSYHGSLTDKFGIRWMFDMPTSPSTDEAKLQQALKSASQALRASAKVSSTTAAKLEAMVEEAVGMKTKIAEEK